MMLTQLWNEPFVARLGWTLLHFVWQGALIGLIASVVLRFMHLRTSQSRYAVMLFFLGTCAVCPPLTYWSLSRSSDIVSIASGPTSEEHVARANEQSTHLAVDMEAAAEIVVPPRGQTNQLLLDTADSSSTLGDTLALPRIEFSALQSYVPWCVVAWCLGVLVFSLRLAGGWWLTRRLFTRGVTPLRARWQPKVHTLADQLHIKVPVRWLESATVTVPVTIGFLRPVVIVPTAVLLQLPPTQIECLLAHELIHIRRCDYLVVWFQNIVEVLLFYHPAIWWLSRRIRQEREQVCDDLVVGLFGDRLVYTRALLAAAENVANQPLLALSTAGGALQQRIARILGKPQRQSSLSNWTIPLSLVTAIGGMCAYLSVADETNTPQSPDPNLAAVANAAQTEAFATGHILIEPVAGQVVDNQRRPVAGARVYLRHRPMGIHGTYQRPTGDLDLATVTSDAEGRFRFSGIQVENATRGLDIVCVDGGYAIGWSHLARGETSESVEIVLQPETRLTGRVVDLEGTPVGDARVSLKYVMSVAQIAQSALDKDEWPSQDDGSTLSIAGFRAPPSCVTDDDGRFQLRALPSNSGVRLQVDHPQFLLADIHAATVDSREAIATLKPKRDIQIGPLNVSLTLARRLKVQVVYGDTGEPAVGAKYGNQTDAFNRDPTNFVDDEGRFEIGHIENHRLQLIVQPPSDSDYLTTTQRVVFAEGEVAKSQLIELTRGAVVTGRVVDRQTGIGIGNTPIHVVTPASTRPANDPDPASRPIYESFNTSPSPIQTDANGSFRAAVVSGEVTVAIEGMVPGYRTYQQFGQLELEHIAAKQTVTAKLDEPSGEVVLELDPAPVVRGIVYDPDGRPVPRALILSRVATSAFSTSQDYSQANEKGEYVLSHVYSQINREFAPRPAVVTVSDPKRGLAAIVSLPEEIPAADLTVDIHLDTLGIVTGRLVNSDTKQPVVDAPVDLLRLGSDPPSLYPSGPRARTDEDGRFQLRGVFKGFEHYISVPSDLFIEHDQLRAKFQGNPAQAHDVGTLNLTPKELPADVDQSPYVAPSIDGLSEQDAIVFLSERYEPAYTMFKAQLFVAKTDAAREQLAIRKEPTPAFADAFKRLAESSDDVEVKWSCLQWILGCRCIESSEERILPIKQWAAKIALEDYFDRAEVAQCLSSLADCGGQDPVAILRSIVTASPHREVQGLALYRIARRLAFDRHPRYQSQQQYRLGTPSAAEVAQAIERLERVVQDYADIPTQSGKTLGQAAERDLFALRNLFVGAVAPDISGRDAQGTDMALSDFRGKFVILSFWGSCCEPYPYSQHLKLLKRIEADFADAADDVVVLGVMCDAGEDAHKIIKENGVTFRNWLDGNPRTGPIANRWHIEEWPTTYVLDRDGVIRLKDEHDTSPNQLRNKLWKLVQDDRKE